MHVDREHDRLERLNALAPSDREHLVRIIGEARLDLWSMGAAWPDLVDRCIETVEEDVDTGYVPVRVRQEADAG